MIVTYINVNEVLPHFPISVRSMGHVLLRLKCVSILVTFTENYQKAGGLPIHFMWKTHKQGRRLIVSLGSYSSKQIAHSFVFSLVICEISVNMQSKFPFKFLHLPLLKLECTSALQADACWGSLVWFDHLRQAAAHMFPNCPRQAHHHHVAPLVQSAA